MKRVNAGAPAPTGALQPGGEPETRAQPVVPHHRGMVGQNHRRGEKEAAPPLCLPTMTASWS